MTCRLFVAVWAIAFSAIGAAAQAAPITVDFRNDFPGYAVDDIVEGDVLMLKGITVTGTADGAPSTVHARLAFGIGVINSTTGSGESIRFGFGGAGARDVGYGVTETGVSGGDFPTGRRNLEAFGLDAQSLGVFAQEDGGPFDVTALFGDAPISAFALTAASGPGDVTYDFDVSLINYTPVPVPPAILLLLSGLVATGVMRFARRRRTI